MRLRRWLHQRWCGLTIGHMFTRHCDADGNWFGERCYLCEHRQRGIDVGPTKFLLTAKVERKRLWWVRGVHFGKRA